MKTLRLKRATVMMMTPAKAHQANWAAKKRVPVKIRRMRERRREGRKERKKVMPKRKMKNDSEPRYFEL